MYRKSKQNFKDIQFSSVTQSCPTLCDDPMDSSMPGLPVHCQFLELAQTHVHWVGDAIQLSHPLSSPFPPAFNLSQHQVFSNESVLCIRWPTYWSFSFGISSSNEYSGLISFRMGWFDLAVQGTFKSLLQHHSSKALILWRSAFFKVQLFPCGSAGKESTCTVGDLDLIPGLGRYPAEGKDYPLQYFALENSRDCIVHGVAKSWISLRDFHFLTSMRDYWKNHSFDQMKLCWQSNVSAFNMLSRFVAAFLPKSKHILISWL